MIDLSHFGGINKSYLKGLKMTKTEYSDAVLAILKKHNIEDESLINDFKELFKSKKRGSENPPIEKDGELYFYDRYTGLYFPKEYTIFQNDQKKQENKSKGYSKLGISLWTRGKKLIESKKNELFDLVMKDKVSKEEKEKMTELKKFLETANFNDIQWLKENVFDKEKDGATLVDMGAKFKEDLTQES